MLKIFMVTAVLVASYSIAKSNPIDAGAQINNYDSQINPDGSYSYQFDTTNGISAQESGIAGKSISGSSQYYDPDGQLVHLTYIADENGFRPQGDHLPTPPPIPDYIQRALDYIRSHPPHEDQVKYSQTYQEQQYRHEGQHQRHHAEPIYHHPRF